MIYRRKWKKKLPEFLFSAALLWRDSELTFMYRGFAERWPLSVFAAAVVWNWDSYNRHTTYDDYMVHNSKKSLLLFGLPFYAVHGAALYCQLQALHERWWAASRRPCKKRETGANVPNINWRNSRVTQHADRCADQLGRFGPPEHLSSLLLRVLWTRNKFCEKQTCSPNLYQ